ncbi:MAG: FlgD immunoglobulin-like domain containing protein [Bacteroidota bacterium]
MMTRLLFFTVCLVSLANTQWRENGIPVCDTSANSGFSMLPQIAPDGEGGAFVCWRDKRNGDFDIYARRIGRHGEMLWQRNGIPIIQAPNSQEFPRIISDGRGGAFIAWEDSRSDTNTYVYAQRIDSRGEFLWQPGGVQIAETPGLFISLVDDGNGGLLVAWNAIFGFEPGTGIIDGVYVQRLDSFGNRVWPDSGVEISNRPGRVWLTALSVVSDDAGGAIIAWSEGEFTQERVYAQRIGNTGKPLWTKNGIEISDSVGNTDATITSDHSSGAIIGWFSSSNFPDVVALKFVQRVRPDGAKLWEKNGILLGDSRGGGAQRQTPDGNGGAFIGHGKWIQHIDLAGVKRWEGEGAQYTDTTTGYFNSSQALGLNGGIWNFWSQNISPGIVDIRGQYISSDGIPKWGYSGKPVCDAPLIQDWAKAVPDANGGAVIVWDDFRNRHSSIYAAKVDTTGIVVGIYGEQPVIPKTPELEQNYPNPFNPATIIEYKIPSSDRVQLIIYDSLGKEIIMLVNQHQRAGVYKVTWDGRNTAGARVASGIYFYRIIVDNSYQVTKKSLLLK